MIVASCALALLAVDADATAAPRKDPAPKKEVATTDYELEVLCPKAADLIRLFATQLATHPDRYGNKDWKLLRDAHAGFKRACPGVPL
jgi:hypothetical protein